MKIFSSYTLTYIPRVAFTACNLALFYYSQTNLFNYNIKATTAGYLLLCSAKIFGIDKVIMNLLYKEFIYYMIKCLENLNTRLLYSSFSNEKVALIREYVDSTIKKLHQYGKNNLPKSEILLFGNSISNLCNITSSLISLCFNITNKSYGNMYIYALNVFCSTYCSQTYAFFALGMMVGILLLFVTLKR